MKLCIAKKLLAFADHLQGSNLKSTDVKKAMCSVPKRDHMDDPGTVWRHGVKPDYSVVNKKYMDEKTKKHGEGSMEEFVENLVKTWEVENSYKIRAKDWKTVDQEKFTIRTNGGPKFTLKDILEQGSFNLLLDESILWQSMTNQESQDAFKGALPGGFAWELTELISGPPVVCFTWRHWGKWEGKFKDREPNGKLIELFGSCIARVDDKQKIQSIDVYFDPNPMMAMLTGFDKTKGTCPFTKS